MEKYFSATIRKPGGELFDSKNSIYFLPPNSIYEISFCNSHPSRRLDVSVKVDGKDLGKFRCGENKFMVVKRFVDVNKSFLFKPVDLTDEKTLSDHNFQHNGKIALNVFYEPKKVPAMQRLSLIAGTDEVDGGDNWTTVKKSIKYERNKYERKKKKMQMQCDGAENENENDDDDFDWNDEKDYVNPMALLCMRLWEKLIWGRPQAKHIRKLRHFLKLMVLVTISH